MNKKNIFVLLAMVTAMTSAVSGCSDSSESDMPAVTTAAPNNYVAAETDITVSGEVTAIVGNEVTLALGTLSENTSSDGKDADAEDDAEGDTSGGDMPGGDMPDFGGDMPEAGGGMPDFGGDMPGGDMSGGGGRKSRSSATLEKTGEEGKYIIPVGMTIDGLTGRSVDYSGISVGTVLTLTISQDGIVRAASVE